MVGILSFLVIVFILALCYYIGNLILGNFNEDWRGRLYGLLLGFFVAIWTVPVSFVLIVLYRMISQFLSKHV
jgi:hypothetical protein